MLPCSKLQCAFNEYPHLSVVQLFKELLNHFSFASAASLTALRCLREVRFCQNHNLASSVLFLLFCLCRAHCRRTANQQNDRSKPPTDPLTASVAASHCCVAAAERRDFNGLRRRRQLAYAKFEDTHAAQLGQAIDGKGHFEEEIFLRSTFSASKIH